jgi:hypothetical protein
LKIITGYISGGLFLDAVQYQVNPWQGFSMTLAKLYANHAPKMAEIERAASEIPSDNYRFL